MAIDRTACVEYLDGWGETDLTTIREAALGVLGIDEPVLELDVPAALTGRVTTLPDQVGLLALLAACANEETIVDGVNVYAAEVGGVAKIFARRVSS